MPSTRGLQRLSLARLTGRGLNSASSPLARETAPSYQSRAAELHERWRALEAQYGMSTDPGSRTGIAASMAALRTEYQQLVRSAAVEGAPLPPPFPYHEPPSAPE
jgi:hypothetical protein